jgi:hypothetical protein
MIDILSSEAAMSERAQRKQQQKELRQRMDAEERQRAIDDMGTLGCIWNVSISFSRIPPRETMEL